eukprot:6189366-Pleurochrysis_carterae.AAC.1
MLTSKRIQMPLHALATAQRTKASYSRQYRTVPIRARANEGVCIYVRATRRVGALRESVCVHVRPLCARA